jgi:hypothetical protein
VPVFRKNDGSVGNEGVGETGYLLSCTRGFGKGIYFFSCMERSPGKHYII